MKPSDYFEAIKLKTQDPRAYYNRGRIFDDIGKKEKAFQDYNRAIQLDPKDVDAYNNRGSKFDDMGKKEKAL